MATPQIQRAVLVIADIGGYTKFMKLTRFNLAHAQQVVADLLEAVLDAAPPLKLSKLEGDAALFWAPLTADGAHARELGPAVARIRGAFMARRSQMSADNTCSCDACKQIDCLTLKFVAHQGEVALQKVKRHLELAGVDVILVHRMLKNEVPISEYVLVTGELLAALPDELKALAESLAHDFEGLGEVQTHYVDLTRVPLPKAAAPKTGPLRRLWQTLRKAYAVVPQLLGLSKPLHGYERTRAAITPGSGPA